MYNGIANTNPVSENYEKFVNLVRRSSNKNIIRGCRTSYVCGLNDQSKDMYEDYQKRIAEDPFNEDTVRVGDALLDEISEAQRSKWKEMIESTDFTHSSRKDWKTINKVTKYYTEPQQQCKVTADQVAHQLLLNGKGNKLHHNPAPPHSSFTTLQLHHTPPLPQSRSTSVCVSEKWYSVPHNLITMLDN